MSNYRCTNVVFGFDGAITHITLNCDLELQEGVIWTKVDALVAEFDISGLEDFKNQVVNFVRGMAEQHHERTTTLAAAKTKLEATIFQVD